MTQKQRMIYVLLDVRPDEKHLSNLDSFLEERGIELKVIHFDPIQMKRLAKRNAALVDFLPCTHYAIQSNKHV